MLSLFLKSSRNNLYKGLSSIAIQRTFGRKRAINVNEDDFISLQEEIIDNPPIQEEIEEEIKEGKEEVKEPTSQSSPVGGKYKVSQRMNFIKELDDNEKVDVDTIKKTGFSDLSTKSNIIKQQKSQFTKKELLSHVPQEMTVMRYGYVDNRVLNVLEEIINTSGLLSYKTLNAISIVDMNLEEDGRDINIHYQLKSSRNNSLNELLDRNDDDLSSYQIRNSRYIEKSSVKKRTKTNLSYLQKQKELLESTNKYKNITLSLDDVCIIDEINKSTKAIRFKLCKELNIKRVPQLHFIHDVK